MNEGVNLGGRWAIPFFLKVYVEGVRGHVEDFVPQEMGGVVL